MGKRARAKANQDTPSPGEVGPRQPCPCGSGRRYKACHGSAAGPPSSFTARPFEGLPGETDIVALRELVPAATAPLTLREGVGAGRLVLLCSLLPMAAPAMVRPEGEIWLGLQVQHRFGDPSRDLGAVLEKAFDAEPGSRVGLTDPPGEGARLQDLVDPEAPLEVTVHEGFDFWGADAVALEGGHPAANPTERLTSVKAAYWTNAGTKEHLRWVLPYDEERLLSALARLHASGRDVIADGSRLVGMFRAHGLLAPVWDLPVGTGAAVLEEPVGRLAKELEEAVADESPLSTEERSARNGLANRQLTIR